jgi:hypothetical protein
MDNPPKFNPRILEAIEACRPGSEDLSDAELRTVRDKLKQTDVVLAEAFHDVPVPEGLADRIVDRLASSRHTLASPEGPDTTDGDTAELPSPIAKRGKLPRRRWVFSAVGLAVAGSLLASFVILGGPREELTEGTVVDAAVMLFDEESNPPPNGSLTSEKSPPGSFRISPLVAHLTGIRWRWTDKFLDRQAVAYDLTTTDGARATLYVVKRRVSGLPDSPPYNPAYDSRSRCAAAWQSGRVLYVLVVDGGKEAYRNVLGISSSSTWT